MNSGWWFGVGQNKAPSEENQDEAPPISPPVHQPSYDTPSNVAGHSQKLDSMLDLYSEKNEELGHREDQVKSRINELESVLPAATLWNSWRTSISQQIVEDEDEETEDDKISRAELEARLDGLRERLANESALLAESRQAEADLQKGIARLEAALATALPATDAAIFHSLSVLANERLTKDKHIEELKKRERLYKESLQQADGLLQRVNSINSSISSKDPTRAANAIYLNNRRTMGPVREQVEKIEHEVRVTSEELAAKERERVALEQDEAQLQMRLARYALDIHRLEESAVSLSVSGLPPSSVTSDSLLVPEPTPLPLPSEKHSCLEKLLRELKINLLTQKQFMNDGQKLPNVIGTASAAAGARGTVFRTQPGNYKTKSARLLQAIIKEIDSEH